MQCFSLRILSHIIFCAILTSAKFVVYYWLIEGAIMAYTGKIHIVYDGMWGSCGKGKFCAELALDPSLNISVCVNNNAPNAGHTFVFDDGRKVVTHHLPIGIVNPNIPYLVIGEGSVINPQVLKDELIKYQDLVNGRKIYIADSAAIVNEEDIAYEKQNQNTGSTNQGAGAALVAKIMRRSTLAAGNPTLQELASLGKIEFVDAKTFFPTIYKGMNGFTGTENILVEGCQGDALGVNGNSYPYSTSRDCGPSQSIDYIHAEKYSQNARRYCVFRPYAIRINNISTTGDYIYTGNFQGAKEIDWDTVSARAGLIASRVKKQEQTTVTKKLRRVAEFSPAQFAEMLLDTQPDECFLNFAEYINGDILNMDYNQACDVQEKFTNPDYLANHSQKTWQRIASKNFAIEQVLDYITEMEEYFNSLKGALGLKITRIGTGAKLSQTLHVGDEGLKHVSLSTFAHRAKLNPLDYADKNNIPSIFIK